MGLTCGPTARAWAGGALATCTKQLRLEAIVKVLIDGIVGHVDVDTVSLGKVALHIEAQHATAEAILQSLLHLGWANRVGCAHNGGLRKDLKLSAASRVSQVQNGLHDSVDWEAKLFLQIARELDRASLGDTFGGQDTSMGT